MVRCGENRTVGTFNVSGQLVPFGDVIAACRAVTGSTADLVPVSPAWLREEDVEEFSGPRSLPLWITDPEAAGFAHRNTDAAVEAGLTWRPIEEIIESALRWERELGLGRDRKSGLWAEHEQELLEAWSAAS